MYSVSPTVFSVTELNNYVKRILETDENLKNVFVTGEISNFKNHYSGHMYMTIKDEGGAIKSVMFSSYASRLKFLPENGMKVIIFGSVSLYNKDGTKKFDETRINAVKQAISFYKSGKRVKVYVNGVSNGYTATKASSLVNVTSALQTKVYEGVKWASDLIIDEPSFEPEMETDPLEELLTDNSLSPSMEASTTIVPEAPDSSASIEATITSPPNETPAFSEVAPKIPTQNSNLWIYFIVGGVALITCGAVLTVIIIKKKSKN